jgi:type II secretory pathway pseudopilin PulG
MGMEKINVSRRMPVDVAVVVFGTDRSKKLHASRFGAAAAKSAQEAARTMGMQALKVVTEEQRAVALRLPKGTVTAAGKAVVPFVKLSLYRQLIAVAGPDTPPAAPPPGQPAKPPTLPPEAVKKSASADDAKSDTPGSSPDLAKGAVVLATDDPDGGWWPATVQSVEGELLTLRWQSPEWKDWPTFIRKLPQVALMPKGKPC